MLSAPVMAAEAPTMTGDPGTAEMHTDVIISAPAAPAPPPAAEPEPPLQPQEVTVPADILKPTEVIPEGLRYIIALPADNERAYRTLVAALAQAPHDFRSLMPKDGETTTYTGIFMALYGLDGQQEKTKLLNTVTYKIPFSDIITKEISGYGAKTPQQLEMLAAAYMENVKIQPGYKIRKLTPDEMKIFWYSSARDIYEPVFVVEDGAHKYIFDMNNTGETLEFLEDLGRPCFNEMGQGEIYTPCKCVKTLAEGLKHTVVFEGCPAKDKTGQDTTEQGKE